MVEEPTFNVGCINFKKKKANSKEIIYDFVKDYLIPVSTPLNTAKEFFDTLMNLYEKKALIKKRDLKNNIWNVNMEKEKIVA